MSLGAAKASPAQAMGPTIHLIRLVSMSALQRRAVPSGKPRRRFVRALEKRHQLALG
jgi:hypothetical protein